MQKELNSRDVRCKESNKFCSENASARRDDRLSLRHRVIQIREDNVSALYTFLLIPRSYVSWSAAILSGPSYPFSVCLDVRQRASVGVGFAAGASPCTPLDSGMRYISREKTSSIDNLLEELARVHANFWIIMPLRVHYASYRAPSVASLASFRPLPLLSCSLISPCLAPAHDETSLQLSTPARLSSPIALCN